MGPGSNQFCDIFILLGNIEDAELQFKFNAVNEANQTSPGQEHDIVLRYDLISKVLTGFARKITYINTS